MAAPSFGKGCTCTSRDYEPSVCASDMQPSVGVLAHSLYNNLGAFRGAKIFTDMEVRCKDKKWPFHRAIVCSQSTFFLKALGGGWKVRTPYLWMLCQLLMVGLAWLWSIFSAEANQETGTSIVELPEEDPDMVERFIDFLYRRQYNELDDTLSFDRLAVAAGLNPVWSKKRLEANSKTGASDDKCPLLSPRQEFGLPSGLPKPWSQPPPLWYRDLFFHFGIYLMGDRYDVPALRLYSSAKFRGLGARWYQLRRLPDYWFFVLIDMTYSALPGRRSDDMMRRTIAHLVVPHLYAPKVWQELGPLLEKHADLARDLLEHTLDITAKTAHRGFPRS